MLKIDKVILQNLQSHVETCLDLSPGLNVVTGNSESGKTAMLRGDRLLVENKPLGTAWVRKDKNDEPVGTLVVTHFYNNGYQVSRVRGKSVNRYIVTSPDGTPVNLEGFGDKVPEEVLTVTGIRPAVFFDDGKGNRFAPVLNFAFQMDAPFLLSETGSLVAKVFGKLAGSELVDAALDDLNKDIHDAQRRKRTAEDEIQQKELLLKQYEGLDRVRALFDRSEIIFKAVLADVDRFNLLETLASDLGKVDAEVIRVKGALDALAGLQRGEIALAEVTVGWVRYCNLAGLLEGHRMNKNALQDVNFGLAVLTGLNALENALAGIKANQGRVDRLLALENDYWTLGSDLAGVVGLLEQLDRLPEDEAFLGRLREHAGRLELLTGLSTAYTESREALERVDRDLAGVVHSGVAGVILNSVADAQKRLSGLTELDQLSKTLASQLTTVRDALDVLGDPEKAGGILDSVKANTDRGTRLISLLHQYRENLNGQESICSQLSATALEIERAEADYWQILKDAGVCPTCGQKVEGGLNCGH